MRHRKGTLLQKFCRIVIATFQEMLVSTIACTSATSNKPCAKTFTNTILLVLFIPDKKSHVNAHMLQVLKYIYTSVVCVCYCVRASVQIYMQIHAIYLSTYLPIYLSTDPSIHPSRHPSIHPSICTCISTYNSHLDEHDLLIVLGCRTTHRHVMQRKAVSCAWHRGHGIGARVEGNLYRVRMGVPLCKRVSYIIDVI